MRGDREQKLSFVLGIIVISKEFANDRQIAEQNNATATFTHVITNQSANDSPFAIFERQHRVGIGTGQGDNLGAIIGGLTARNSADFQVHLGDNRIVELNSWFNVEFDPDIDVGNAVGFDITVRGDGNHRFFTANMDFGLLLVLHPDFRIRQNFGIGPCFKKIESQGR